MSTFRRQNISLALQFRSARRLADSCQYINSAVETHFYSIPTAPPAPSAALSAASSPGGKQSPDEVLAIRIPAESKPLFGDQLLLPNKEKQPPNVKISGVDQMT